MGKGKYESPKFDFQEMKLMERVADQCWGQAHWAWFDADKDGVVDDDEKYSWTQGASCDAAAEQLKNKLIANGVLPANPTKDQEKPYVQENINSGAIKPIYS